jgi:hypothetical protein
MDFYPTSYRRYAIGSDARGFVVYDDTASAYRMEIDASGNLGLGVTPSAWNSGAKALQVGARSSLYYLDNAGFQYTVTAHNVYNDTSGGDIYLQSGAASQYYQSSGQHVWRTAASGTAGNAISFTQAMSLLADGTLLVGTTSAYGVGLTLKPSGEFSSVYSGTSGTHCLFINNNGTIGSIASSGSTTFYNTSSDYRLKNTIAPMTGALAKVALLKPCTYKWNADGSDGEGFIAHELAEVVPQCVTGQKDAVDAEGKPQYQGIDTSFLVATLTAALQELNAKFDAYVATHP